MKLFKIFITILFIVYILPTSCLYFHELRLKNKDCIIFSEKFDNGFNVEIYTIHTPGSVILGLGITSPDDQDHPEYYIVQAKENSRFGETKFDIFYSESMNSIWIIGNTEYEKINSYYCFSTREYIEEFGTSKPSPDRKLEQPWNPISPKELPLLPLDAVKLFVNVRYFD
ncbi:MAG: hypothetical protein PHQ11_10385 [Paludibacter sp.]|nr:hypothetical protein [Paludibacter sp.]